MSVTQSPAPPSLAQPRTPPTREELLATRPKRADFASDDEFDEARYRWMSTVGRSPILRRPPTG